MFICHMSIRILGAGMVWICIFRVVLWLRLPSGEHSRIRLRWDPLRAPADLTAAFVQLFTPGARVSPAVSFTQRETSSFRSQAMWVDVFDHCAALIQRAAYSTQRQKKKISYLNRTHTYMSFTHTVFTSTPSIRPLNSCAPGCAAKKNREKSE